MFWRILTHFIGGMGVLIFLLAVLPLGGDAMHILRAESPGPSASKFVSKIRHTAGILYIIYIVLTVIQTVLLLFGGMDFYEALLTAFSTAGTGGFSIYGDSIAHYNSVYVEMVVAIFMFLFATNFNVFYLIVIGQFAKIFKSEEIIAYVAMVVVATLTIAINLAVSGLNFWDSLRHAFFQTTAISSTTGCSTVDFIQWPTLSKCVLIILMIVGGCGGSTCGGIKVSRTLLLFKTCQNGIKKSLHPRAITTLKLDGEILSKETERNTSVYFIIWVAIVIALTLLLSFDPACDQVLTAFTASLTCIGNVGPGMTELIGPLGNFASFSGFSKIIMSVVMLAGRLEILPMIILFAPRTWIRGQ
jgi:trk system potassium uptake protein TrkH